MKTGEIIHKFIKLTAIILFATSLGGCAAALVGGAFYHSAQTNSQRTDFTTNFQKQNVEREKARLKPLDWCSEAYKFDKGWAMENPECAGKIRNYEAGDKSALKI